MEETRLSADVHDQHRRALQMFREAVDAFPPDEWRQGDTPYQRPAGLALHIVETIEFYISGQPVDGFAWGHRFGVDWEGGASEELPDQPALLAYLADVEEELVRWLGDVDLLAPEVAYPWTGASVAGRAIYVIRNTQHHVSEMCLELTRRGIAAPEWQ